MFNPLTLLNQKSSMNRRAYVVVGLLLILLLLPFSTKPVHIDDTVYVAIAKQILLDPFHPYQFDFNWLGQPESMWLITLHPPLHCYLLATVGYFAGLNEFVLHLLCGGLAVGCSLIMLSVASRFCEHPVLATLLTVLTPAFFVSATTLMADIPMLFFWLLAVYFAVRAANADSPAGLWLAAIAGCATAMTKYFAIAIVPLLVVYVYWVLDSRDSTDDQGGQTQPQTRPAFRPVMILFLPIVVLVGWGVYSQQQPDYGFFHPFAAAHFSTMHKTPEVLFSTTRTTLAFLGGSLVWPLLMIPMAFRLSRSLKCLVIGLLLTVVLAEHSSQTDGGTLTVDWARMFVFSAMAGAGISLLVICAASCSKRRDVESLLLGLWCFGTLVFAAVVNWTVNARILVPAIFPAAVLVIRWIETLDDRKRWLSLLKYGLWPVVLLALVLSFADHQFAGASKQFAQTTVRNLVRKGEIVLFAGHWGFQFYMEQEGAKALDHYGEFRIAGDRAFEKKRLPQPGELIVYPTNNSGLESESMIMNIEKISQRPYSSLFGLHLMSRSANAGFYSTLSGSQPFGIAPDGITDRFTVYRVVEPR